MLSLICAWRPCLSALLAANLFIMSRNKILVC